MSTTTEETERFKEFFSRVYGIILPYAVTADETFKGNFSRIIRVSILIAGVEKVLFTPWTL